MQDFYEAVDWEKYFDPILDDTLNLKGDITGFVRRGDPVAIMDYNSARYYRQEKTIEMLHERGVSTEIELYNHPIVGKSHNIIATFNEGCEKTLYLSTHTDYIAGTGADDNGSGIAIILAAYDVLKEKDLPFTVKCAFFDTEEIDSGGAYTHLGNLSSNEKENIIGNINLDCAGSGKDIIIPIATTDAQGQRKFVYVDEDFHNLAMTSASNQDILVNAPAFSMFYDDHVAFLDHTIPGLTITSCDLLSDDMVNPQLVSPVHTEADTYSCLNTGTLDKSLSIVLGMVDLIVRNYD